MLAALLWVTVELGWWPAVVGAAAVVGALIAAAWASYRRTAIWVSPHGLVERGFFGATRRARTAQVGSVIRLDLYRSNSLDTSPQLFVVDHDGRLLLRMRGDYWEDADLDAVAPSLGVAETRRPTPVTLAELRASEPQLLYWFERIGSRG